MNIVKDYEARVLGGEILNACDGIILSHQPVSELGCAADRIRKHFCGNSFDICTIINAKSGKCSEDCKFCAQSAFYEACSETYPLLPKDDIVKKGVTDCKRGVLRYSIVTSGKALDDNEIDFACEAIKKLHKECSIRVCVSMGLLTENQFKKLREAGADRVHNNIESSRRFFPSVCSTHTTSDKINTILAAQKAGLNICSGGIIGLGETMEDRIDMLLTVRQLGVKSVPVNLLNPIPGTPFERNNPISYDEIKTTVAVFRFLLPDAAIRLAGGRGLLPDHGRELFISGANAAISGDMLTTTGYTIESDLKMIKELGYEPSCLDN